MVSMQNFRLHKISRSLHKNNFSWYDLLKTLLVGMDHGKGLKNRGTFASEASGPQKLEKLHLGGNLKFFGYGVNCVQ